MRKPNKKKKNKSVPIAETNWKTEENKEEKNEQTKNTKCKKN